MTNISSIPPSVLGNILTFIPEEVSRFPTLSRGCKDAIKDKSSEKAFIASFFQELSKELGEERLSQLFGRPTWDRSKTSINEFTAKVYQYARKTVFGEAVLKTQPLHEMFSASELVTIVKLRDQEENENLVKMASKLPFLDTSALYANIEDTGQEDISSLKAQAIREAIAAMSEDERNNVTRLNLASLKLTSIPKEIFLFTNVQSLILGDNQLRTLPPEFGNLTKLEDLNLCYNQLTTLPPEFGNLTKLEDLNLCYNQLRTLPPEFGKLIRLGRLGLTNNQLEALPPEFGKLINLGMLGLENNQLRTLPLEFSKLTRLDYLSLKNNLGAHYQIHNRLQMIIKKISRFLILHRPFQTAVNKLLNFLHRHRRLIFSLSTSCLILLSIRSSIMANLKKNI